MLQVYVPNVSSASDVGRGVLVLILALGSRSRGGRGGGQGGRSNERGWGVADRAGYVCGAGRRRTGDGRARAVAIRRSGKRRRADRGSSMREVSGRAHLLRRSGR